MSQGCCTPATTLCFVPQGVADAIAEPAMRRGECPAGRRTGCSWGGAQGSEEGGEQRLGATSSAQQTPALGRTGCWLGWPQVAWGTPITLEWLMCGCRGVWRWWISGDVKEAVLNN